MLDLVVKDGTIVTATDQFRADVGIVGERIAAIGLGLEGKQTLDASGRYVCPGAIDPHTHIKSPFMGTYSADDWRTGTIAAAASGVTTILDFAVQARGTSLRQTWEAWRKNAEGQALVDYGFHIAITDFSEDRAREIPGLAAEGLTTLKVFLAYKGWLMVDDHAYFRILQAAKAAGILTLVHCENGDMIDVLQRQHLAEGKVEPKYHPLSRPVQCEVEAVTRTIAMADYLAHPVYIVHLSTGEALDAIRRAQARGVPVLTETCPQYLILTEEVYDAPGFEAAKYVCSPPIRSARHREAMWGGLEHGGIALVSSDHSPFNLVGQKDMGRGDYTKMPNGVPGVETRVPLLFSAGVGTGRLSPSRFVELVSTAPAKIFGLFPAKGTLAVGSDADLMIIDPLKRVRLGQRILHQNVDHTPYEGLEVTGYPVCTIARGEVIFREGELVGRPGRGRFVRRARYGQHGEAPRPS
jgi:dihydropyrimidinase